MMVLPLLKSAFGGEGREKGGRGASLMSPLPCVTSSPGEASRCSFTTSSVHCCPKTQPPAQTARTGYQWSPPPPSILKPSLRLVFSQLPLVYHTPTLSPMPSSSAVQSERGQPQLSARLHCYPACNVSHASAPPFLSSFRMPTPGSNPPQAPRPFPRSFFHPEVRRLLLYSQMDATEGQGQ